MHAETILDLRPADILTLNNNKFGFKMMSCIAQLIDTYTLEDKKQQISQKYYFLKNLSFSLLKTY